MTQDDTGIFIVRPVRKVGNSYHVILPKVFVEGALRLSPDMPDSDLWVRFEPLEYTNGYTITPCSLAAISHLNGSSPEVEMPVTERTVYEDDVED